MGLFSTASNQHILLLLVQFQLLLPAKETAECEMMPLTDLDSIKQDLTAANYLLDDMGWHSTVYQHISYRHNNHSVIMPRYNVLDDKLLFVESTIDQLSDVYQQIYTNRSDINVIFHVQNPDISTISLYPHRFLPVSQWYYDIYPITYTLNDLIENKESYVLLLDDLGVLVMGNIIHDTYFRLWFVINGAKHQIATLSILDKKDIIFPPKEIQLKLNKSICDRPPYEGYILGIVEWNAHKRVHGYSDNRIINKELTINNMSYLDFRYDLAKCFNLIGKLDWGEMVYNHFTARLPTNHLLINAFGLHYNEITPYNLVEFTAEVNIDLNTAKCSVINSGNSVPPFNGRILIDGCELHTPIYSVRDDINFIIHIHHPILTAISVYKHGLLPLNKLYFDIVRPITYHSFTDFAVNQNKLQIINDIGNDSHVVIMRNHGILTTGKTMSDAFNRLYYTIKAAELQVNVMKMGLLNTEFLKELIEYKNEHNNNNNPYIIAKGSHLNIWERLQVSQHL